MDQPLELHPSELAYIFSYMHVGTVIGWGTEPFAPPRGLADPWYTQGRDRLLRAGRLVPGKQPGRHRFSEPMLRIAKTLSDPQIVLLTQRKHADGVRTLTVHVAGSSVVEMSLRADQDFSVLEHPTLAAAAGAAAAFAGAAREPVDEPARIEGNHKVFARIDQLADEGRAESALPALMKLGAGERQARSALRSFARPAASAVISLMYCAANAVQDAEVYTLLTNEAGESWVLFPPAAADGPVVLERTSIGALAARILVTVSARMMLPV